MEVVQGPLLNPRRLEEALKASKFGRRLLSFFHPLNFRFSDVKRTKARLSHSFHDALGPHCDLTTLQPNLRWIRLGCVLLTTLLANPDGVAFLLADKFLAQLSDCFAELDHVCCPVREEATEGELMASVDLQYHGSISSDPFLSKRRLDDTLTGGYFEMLGTLSQHVEGVKSVPTLLLSFAFKPDESRSSTSAASSLGSSSSPFSIISATSVAEKTSSRPSSKTWTTRRGLSSFLQLASLRY